MPDLLRSLLDTGALQVAPAARPFWYTSGTLGPFYVNTEYLYGSREKAEGFLEVIEREKDDPLRCPGRLLEEVQRNHSADAIYRGVLDRIVEVAGASVDMAEIDYVSGGERRDWFFSLMAGVRLGKPLLLIFKDLRIVSVAPDGTVEAVKRLQGKRALHVADLVTEASSYVRGWAPAVADRGGRLTHAINVVDRDQGGEDALRNQGIAPYSLVRIDDALFKSMRRQGRIDEAQLRMLLSYRADPRAAMKAFLQAHPEFLKEALASPDPKTASRARLLVETDPYGIGRKDTH